MDTRMMGAMSDEMMSMPGMDTVDMQLLQAAMDACAACEQACTVCSTEMLSCAPACMNCADMCNTMLRAMLRMRGMTPATMMSMLDACIAMCEACEDECLEHAAHSVVCEMCARACRACADACQALKESMSAAA